MAARRDPLVRGRAADGSDDVGDTPTGVALFRSGTRWQELLQCSADLEAVGIVAGTPLKEAQARYPDARYLPCDDDTLAAISASFAAIVTALAPYSPVIEPALGVVPGLSGRASDGIPAGVAVDPARAVAFLDVAGLEARYGPEVDLAAHLASTAQAAAMAATAPTGSDDPSIGIAPAVAVGVAGGKFTAWVAAATAFAHAAAAAMGAAPTQTPRRLRWREIAGPDTLAPDLPPPDRASAASRRAPTRGRGIWPTSRTAAVPLPLPTPTPPVAAPPPILVVPPGEVAAFLNPLPLTTLPLAMGVRRALERLGLRTLGRFATLPANAVMARYGSAARYAHRLAAGYDDEPLRPPPTPLEARVGITFEWEETDLDRLTFVLRSLAGQLVARLHALGRPDGATDAADPDPDAAANVGFDATAPDPLPPDDDPRAAAFDHDGDGDRVAIGRRDLDDDDEAGTSQNFDDDRAARPRWATTRDAAHRPSAVRPRRPAIPEVPAPYAVEALRVTWLLAPRRGADLPERREALLRLAEPTATGHAFATHLRWHVEGLDRLLIDDESVVGGETAPGDPTYVPMADRRRGVVGIEVEAAGIGTPVANQMALHLVSGPRPAWAREARDPERQARAARLAVARLQARWGEGAVGGLPAADPAARLPEHARTWGVPIVAPDAQARPILASGQSTLPASRHGLEAAAPSWLVDPPRPVGLRRLPTRRVLLDLPDGGSRTDPIPVGRVTGPWHVVDPTTLVDAEPPRRDYFQVETADRRVLLLYRDRAPLPDGGLSDGGAAWFLQGVYD